MNNMHRGAFVVASGTGINLALGVLYAWSIFKNAIKHSIERGAAGDFRWDMASLNDPYAVCCLVFAFAMIAAGKCQDTIGPRKTAFIGGILVGAGLILASQTTGYAGWVLGFGVLAGAGIAFGYSSATPAALKWYHPAKSGKIAGIVVAGFGLASVYIAPLSQVLLDRFGIKTAVLLYGIAFPVAVSVFSIFLVNPPAGYVPPGSFQRRTSEKGRMVTAIKDENLGPSQVITRPLFWMLWLLYFIGAGAGLMVIGSMAGMAKTSMGQKAFLAVAILAIGNAAGRIAAGTLSDRLGRKTTLIIMFAFQSILMFASVPITSKGAANALQIVLLATFIGFNYGANLAIFPSYAKDLWGMKNFGVNYGLLFTSWGMGGLVLSKLSQYLIAGTGNYRSSFLVAGTLLLFGTALAFMIRDRKEQLRQELRRQMLREAKEARHPEQPGQPAVSFSKSRGYR